MWWWNNSDVSDKRTEVWWWFRSGGEIVELCSTLTSKGEILKFIRRIGHFTQKASFLVWIPENPRTRPPIIWEHIFICNRFHLLLLKSMVHWSNFTKNNYKIFLTNTKLDCQSFKISLTQTSLQGIFWMHDHWNNWTFFVCIHGF